MATNGLNKVVWHLRRAVLLKDGAGQSDGKLLGSFIEDRDETAFEVLMRRHGPMVLGLCRRILPNQQDAQDAFQATFLVLVRKAKSVAPRELLGNWLYAVARQTAIRMRSKNAKRWWREKQVTSMPEPQAPTSEPNDDLQMLDQELSRLPEKYRIAIILCDLEGKTRKQAAQQLGWAEGTVSSRLARGKARLAKRLAKHGLLLSAEALAAALSQNMASACLPPTLVSATVKAASVMVTGQTVAIGLISAKVAALAEGVVKGMLLTKMKTMVAVLVVVGMTTYGGGLLVHRTAGASTAGDGKEEATAARVVNVENLLVVQVPNTGFLKNEKETKAGNIKVSGQLVKNPKTEELEAEIEIPREDLGKVFTAFDAGGRKADLDVDILLVALPTRIYKGKLAEEKIQAKPIRAGSSVLAWVRLKGSDIPKKDQLISEAEVNSEVHGRIHLGIQANEPKTKTLFRLEKLEKRSGFFRLSENVEFANGTIKADLSKGNPDDTFLFFGPSRERWELLVTPSTKIKIDRKEAQLAGLQAIKNDSNPEGSVIVGCEYEVLDAAEGRDPKGRAIHLEARGRQANALIRSINVGKFTVDARGRLSQGDALLPVKNVAKNTITAQKLDFLSWYELFRQDLDVTQDPNRKDVEIDVAKEVEVMINGKAAKLTDLKPNMKVILQEAAGKNLVLGITAFGAKVKGVVRSVDAGKSTISINIPSIQITAEAISVAKDAKIILDTPSIPMQAEDRIPVVKDAKMVIDGMPGKLSDLKAGMRVILYMSAEPGQNVVIGIAVEKAAEKK